MTFYNADDERFAVRSPTHINDRYLRQEGVTKPVLSMMPHPFASRRLYPQVSVKNDTPHGVNFVKVHYCGACTKDQHNFIASRGTWTFRPYRGNCLVTLITANMVLPDASLLACAPYPFTTCARTAAQRPLKEKK